MNATVDHLQFAPALPQSTGRSLGLAVLAHTLLLAALTWGVSWNSQPNQLTVEAELWSSLPQAAAPKLEEAPPPVAAAPPEPPKAKPKTTSPDIALEREKKKKVKEKLELEKKLESEKKRLQEHKKTAEDTRKKEEEAKQQDTRVKENIQRMTGLAGATGAPSDTGSALRSSGPSPSYAGRIIARVKPNIVFTEDISANPSAEVEVRTAPDGTIVARKLLQSSGNKAWDEAVLKALDKTEVLPRDTDGRVPTILVIRFRPKD